MTKNVAFVSDGLPTYDVIKTAPYLGSSLPSKMVAYFTSLGTLPLKPTIIFISNTFLFEYDNKDNRDFSLTA